MDRASLKRAGLSCINFNLRKAARAVTAIYDRSLAPVGITSTQFSIMIALAYYPEHSMSALSKFLVMDRTTLTKNLKPLMREKLIEPAAGEDRRQRLLSLTDKGAELERRLTEDQRALVARAYKAAGAEAVEGFKKVLLGLINEEDRARFRMQNPAGPGVVGPTGQGSGNTGSR